METDEDQAKTLPLAGCYGNQISICPKFESDTSLPQKEVGMKTFGMSLLRRRHGKYLMKLYETYK